MAPTHSTATTRDDLHSILFSSASSSGNALSLSWAPPLTWCRSGFLEDFKTSSLKGGWRFFFLCSWLLSFRVSSPSPSLLVGGHGFYSLSLYFTNEHMFSPPPFLSLSLSHTQTQHLNWWQWRTCIFFFRFSNKKQQILWFVLLREKFFFKI